ncbi:hypothetical protein V7x_31230 [Crateriforma conspicua]|uniref:Uncharacterized protein n=1 Tax=Crateriforma conspicua TaxID=2527996 RepID=A0A5C6FXA3_9PLAN|nr:hypothetical protein V7x_31230 [Crateriforma conspicua]
MICELVATLGKPLGLRRMNAGDAEVDRMHERSITNNKFRRVVLDQQEGSKTVAFPINASRSPNRSRRPNQQQQTVNSAFTRSRNRE